MPKVSWAGEFGSETAQAEGGGFSEYDGPLPPKGIYRTRMRLLRMRINKNGDHMLNGLFEIEEPKKSKKSVYNGYGIWWNGNVTAQGAGYINKFLDALGVKRKRFWDGEVIHDGDGDDKPAKGEKRAYTLGNVKKIAGKVINSQEDGPIVGVTASVNKYMGETNLQVASFIISKDSAAESEEDDDEDFDDEESEEDDDEDFDGDEDFEEEDDDDIEEDDDDIEDEEEEEPEPPKRRKPVAAAKKAAPKSTAAARRKKAAVEDDEDEPPF